MPRILSQDHCHIWQTSLSLCLMSHVRPSAINNHKPRLVFALFGSDYPRIFPNMRSTFLLTNMALFWRVSLPEKGHIEVSEVFFDNVRPLQAVLDDRGRTDIHPQERRRAEPLR
jgi:hypothetical protein